MIDQTVITNALPSHFLMGKGALQQAKSYFDGYSKIFILLDENIQRFCMPVFQQLLPDLNVHSVIQVKSGEINKNIQTAISIWEQLTSLHADRDSLLINLGGGVITDIGGFVAATFKRGIDFINIPTTLLGQVDAAIGGKTGIDFHEFKNQLGLFTYPKLVIIDPVFLQTLEEIHWKSGFSETLKYALIMDNDLWKAIDNRHYQELNADWNSIIIKAAHDKINIVKQDGFEQGIRKILNFGHTVGHALETFFLKTDHPITHGEAVAAGMVCETRISTQLSKLSDKSAIEIYNEIDKNFDRLSFSKNNFSELLRLMTQDKKVREGHLKFSLLKKLGEATYDINVSSSLVIKSLEFYLAK